MSKWDIEEIKEESFAAMKGKNIWAITEEPDGRYSLHVHTQDSVHPAFKYAGKREVIARLMQMMEVGPLAPQTWPESVGISEIDYKSADIVPITPKEER